MGDLTINDFRGAMGKYNLGSLKLEGKDENQKLTLVNNHNRLRSLRNTSATTEAENTAVREQFAKAIEKYLAGLKLDTFEGSEVGKFIAAIRADLLGEGSKTRELSRQDDVARVLDKLDAAVALKALMKELATNVKAVYIAEARRARSPRASQRGLQKTDGDGRKRAFGEIANDKDFKAWGNSLQRGEITGLGVFGAQERPRRFHPHGRQGQAVTFWGRVRIRDVRRRSADTRKERKKEVNYGYHDEAD